MTNGPNLSVLERLPLVQALVYTFIGLASLGIGATGYFGLTLTPLESVLMAVMFACVAIVLVERSLRQRAENRLERAIEDLSRLLSTDAQAGAVLGQRINALTDVNAGQRLEGVEADISVLGTVIRQVAEAVSELEEREKRAVRPGAAPEPVRRPMPTAIAAPPREPEPTIPLEMLRQAVEDNRLIYHIQPIVTLPQRRPFGYDLVPRLMLEDGDLADRVDFMPRRGGDDVIRHIEGIALVEAVTIGRRARTAGQPINLFIPLSRSTLGDTDAAEQLLVTLEANRAIAPGITFVITDADWAAMTTGEKAIADAMAKKGTGYSLSNIRSLRVDVAELAAQSVRSLRVDAGRFLDEPSVYTDFHPSDIANYLGRFGVDLLATGISNEPQILDLLDDGITLVQGNHIAAPGPVRPDLLIDRNRSPAAARRAEVQ